MAYKTRFFPALDTEANVRAFFGVICNFFGNEMDFSMSASSTNVYEISLYIDPNNMDTYFSCIAELNYKRVTIKYPNANGAKNGNFQIIAGQKVTLVKSAKGTAGFIGKAQTEAAQDFSNGCLMFGKCEDEKYSILASEQNITYENRNNQAYGIVVGMLANGSFDDIIMFPFYSFFGGQFKEMYHVVSLYSNDSSLVVQNENGYFYIVHSGPMTYAVPIDYIPD